MHTVGGRSCTCLHVHAGDYAVGAAFKSLQDGLSSRTNFTVSIFSEDMCFTQVTMLLVMNNALQGILSSFFFKYADTILKKYSSTMATIFTGVMSAALFGHALTLNFLIGVTVVFISMHQFFSQGALETHSSIQAQRGVCSPALFTLAGAGLTLAI